MVASGLVFSGLAFLAGGLIHICLILGFWLLVCYNGLYTPLKKTLFAVWPGVICGMPPPAIGVTAVPQALCHGTGIQLRSGDAGDGHWQVPHFLILAAAQPVCDPGADRFPSFIRLWPKTELFLQILVWVCVYSLGIFWFLLNGGIVLPGFSASLAGMAFVLPGVMGLFLTRFPAHAGAGGFTTLNLSMLIFMVLGILDRILPTVFPLQ